MAQQRLTAVSPEAHTTRVKSSEKNVAPERYLKKLDSLEREVEGRRLDYESVSQRCRVLEAELQQLRGTYRDDVSGVHAAVQAQQSALAQALQKVQRLERQCEVWEQHWKEVHARHAKAKVRQQQPTPLGIVRLCFG